MKEKVVLSRILNLLEGIYEEVEQVPKIIEICRKIWKVIEYFILVVYIFLICIQLDSIREFLIDVCENAIYVEIIELSYEHTNLLLFILLAVLIPVLLYKMWKIGKLNASEFADYEQFVEKLHTRFLHDVRDNIKELDWVANTLATENEAVVKVTKEKMLQDLSNNMQNYVDFIQEILSNYCGKMISVCIKIIKIENNDSESPLAMTLARSSNTRRKRIKEDENVSIKDNDDFKYLLNGANTFYGKADLIQAHNAGEYHATDSIDVWSKKYKSTLIAPIRYYSKHSNHNNVNLEFDILGFLCIDANEVMPKWEEYDSFELRVLALFADTMYIYLKRYKEAYCDHK